MASINLTTTQDRADFFRETILTKLNYWQGWLETKIADQGVNYCLPAGHSPASSSWGLVW